MTWVMKGEWGLPEGGETDDEVHEPRDTNEQREAFGPNVGWQHLTHDLVAHATVRSKHGKVSRWC